MFLVHLMPNIVIEFTLVLWMCLEMLHFCGTTCRFDCLASLYFYSNAVFICSKLALYQKKCSIAISISQMSPSLALFHSIFHSTIFRLHKYVLRNILATIVGFVYFLSVVFVDVVFLTMAIRMLFMFILIFHFSSVLFFFLSAVFLARYIHCCHSKLLPLCHEIQLLPWVYENNHHNEYLRNVCHFLIDQHIRCALLSFSLTLHTFMYFYYFVQIYMSASLSVPLSECMLCVCDKCWFP